MYHEILIQTFDVIHLILKGFVSSGLSQLAMPNPGILKQIPEIYGSRQKFDSIHFLV